MDEVWMWQPWPSPAPRYAQATFLNEVKGDEDGVENAY